MGAEFRKIVAAVDVDATADVVLRHAHRWACRFGATLALLHVNADGSTQGQRVRHAESEIRGLVAATIPDARPELELIVNPGSPGSAIAAGAAAAGADLIVVGTHGRGTLGRWLVGSVAADVLRTTNLPVLLVHRPPDDGDSGPVVAAVDFSHVSEAVVARAARLAAATGSPLCLLHALPIGDHRSPGHQVMRESAMRTLQELRQRCVPPDSPVELHVAMKMSAVAALIAQHADSSRARLIVIGGHGASGWIVGALGGVTEKVLHETVVPVLVVRSGQPVTGLGT